MHKLLLSLLFFLALQTALAQRGGESTFAYLKLPLSPRIAALGGRVPGYGGEKELSFAIANPAFASSHLHNAVEITGHLLFADAKYNSAAYFFALDSTLTLGTDLRQVWYGRFERRDERGFADGSFAAYEMALGLHAAYRFSSGWSVGVSLTPLYSLLERYWSLGLACDLGVGYTDAEGLLSAGLVLQNLGATLKSYSGRHENAPFELLAGIKVRARHAPLVFVFTLQHLENWQRRFVRESAYSSVLRDGVNPDDKPSLISELTAELFAHPVLGVEFHPFRYFFAQLSYNHARRMEMLIPNQYSTEGFAWGFGVQVQRVALRYSRAFYHHAGATNHFSLAIYFSGGRDAAMRPYRPSPSSISLPVEQKPVDE